MFFNDPVDISADAWLSLLKDRTVTKDKDYQVLEAFYLSYKHEAAASQIAAQLGKSYHSVLNTQIYHFSKRVVDRTKIKPPPKRKREGINWWHVPFLGYQKAGLFIWMLRPELVEAFEMLVGRKSDDLTFAEEFPPADQTFLEGKTKQVSVNIYERSRSARDKCIAHHGTRCCICGFDFQKAYGPIGKNKIHVHHLKRLADIKAGYKVNPVRDLRPVCPNCHLIIHSRTEPFSIKEMLQIIQGPRSDP